MYIVSYIKLTARGPKLISISVPAKETARDIYDAFKIAGVHVRFFDEDKKLQAPREKASGP